MTTTEDANKPLVIADGKLAEHCDVIQDEADPTQSRNGVTTIYCYANAAVNAMRAGFDGIQLQAASII